MFGIQAGTTMQKKLLPIICSVLGLAALVFASPARADGPSISVAVNPPRFEVRDRAVLGVTVSGGNVNQLELPQVKGLTFRSAGQSSRYEIINGTTSSSIEFLFEIRADGPGRYDIPGVSARVNGRSLVSDPVSLEVLASGTGPAGPQTSSGNSASGNPSHLPKSSEGAFVTVKPVKNPAYVGELVPVEVQAWFNADLDASITSLPEPVGQAFTWSPFGSKPERSTRSAAGRTYTVLTWRTALAPVKAGDFPVQVRMEAQIVEPMTQGLMDRFLSGNPFGRSFFDHFQGLGQPREVELLSEAQALTVAALPTEGKPKHFSGAVGQFTLKESAAPARVMAGDPVTLTLEVSGNGHFDRVTCPVLDSDQGWKTFPATSSFVPNDPLGISGVRRFEITGIPQHQGVDHVPAAQFSFFDPETAQYRTLSARPIDLVVDPAPTGPKRTEPEPSSQTVTGPAAPAPPKSTGLAPIEPELGHLVHGYVPLFQKIWFQGALGFSLLAFLCGMMIILWARFKSGNSDPERRRALKKAMAQAGSAMDRALAQDDAHAFFVAGRRISQQRLGRLWNLAPERITTDEVLARLPRDQGLKAFFEAADAAVYSGKRYGREDLARFRNALTTELNRMEDRK